MYRDNFCWTVLHLGQGHPKLDLAHMHTQPGLLSKSYKRERRLGSRIGEMLSANERTSLRQLYLKK
eukprot:5248183-Amphidinium_carterae.1